MNHDYAHCLDFDETCPKKCFRAQLVREIRENPAIAPRTSWMRLKGTEECMRGENRVIDE